MQPRRPARRRVFFGLALVLLVLGCQHVRLSGGALPERPADALRVVSFNVHYIVLGQDEGRWSEGDWHRRKHAMDAAFKALDADIVAFQEMESFRRGSDGSINLARDWLQKRNPDYAVAASGDWRVFPSTQPVFYRPDRLTVQDQGWFFFSDTPDAIYSRTYDGSYPAFASWVSFAGDRGPFLLVNLHTDAFSRDNRRRSLALVAERAVALNADGHPMIVLGDFNVLSGSPLLDPLRALGFDFPRMGRTTYHFDRGLHLFGAIDHVAAAGLRDDGARHVLQSRFDGVWPSDHHPVVADFRFDPQDPS
ncbi:endonuclease/exonuclease/phosphatase family protein [Thalassococcus sp. CAU 1522]|uniref:Endonuclease/exonuclease/phosphatase family protein n=1 Tax=Thalassococcus arenae TaxID=2851652 RepID=A0ABS6NB43_9RHOB|nr:endonuclease/exonuclease/phosphatase family protein [Thalassococcus arenae]